jgi:hypothetical protein
MPIIEKFEVQENRVWYRAEITDEQAKEYKDWQENGAEKNEWEPEWVDDLEWDHHWDKPGNDEVISIELVNEEKK